MTKADLSALVPRRGGEDTTDTEDDTMSLSYHDVVTKTFFRFLGRLFTFRQ